VTPSEKYRIIQRLGDQQRRKFGDVFLVEDKENGEPGILKLISKKTDNHLQQHRLKQEASFNFEHPQLPRTLYLYESDTELFVVRSYSKGVPLGTYMNTIRQKEKIGALTTILQGLLPIFSELKKLQIVHLDLKPSNIIVQPEGDSLSVSLIDFGMAMYLQKPQQRGTLFPLGYAAPELLLNRLHLVDQRTDFFALGIVLWQQLTGKLPLLHPNPGITTNLQLTHPLPDHDLIPKRLFPVLQRLCSKHPFAVPPNRLPEQETDALLRKAMDERYADFREFLHAWESEAARTKRFSLW
jgi:serine/threonine protein kinase